MLLQCLGDLQRLFAPLGLSNALVTPGGPRAGHRWLTGQVFAREHAARHRAVRGDAHAMVGAGRQYLDLGHAIEQVVVGLAHHRPRHAHLPGQVHQLRDAPAPKIGNAPVADLARAQHGIERPQGLLQVHAVVVAVQIENIHMVGLQPPEARLDLAQHPAARIVRLVHAVRHRVAELRGQHPVVALAAQQFAQHGFRSALGVHIGRVDVVHPLGMGIGHDGGCLFTRGLVTKHHGAQAQTGDLEIAFAKVAVLHGTGLECG